MWMKTRTAYHAKAQLRDKAYVKRYSWQKSSFYAVTTSEYAYTSTKRQNTRA
jgi:hypothetical protein